MSDDFRHGVASSILDYINANPELSDPNRSRMADAFGGGLSSVPPGLGVQPGQHTINNEASEQGTPVSEEAEFVEQIQRVPF